MLQYFVAVDVFLFSHFAILVRNFEFCTLDLGFYFYHTDPILWSVSPCSGVFALYFIYFSIFPPQKRILKGLRYQRLHVFNEAIPICQMIIVYDVGGFCGVETMKYTYLYEPNKRK